MSSLAAKVNEKHYQCRLVLAESMGLDPQRGEYQAQKQALEQSCCLLLGIAYQLFLEEIAHSCQIKDMVYHLKDLKAILENEERSHPVIDTLLILETTKGSWLNQLQNAIECCHGGNRLISSRSNNVAILASDLQQSFDIQDCLISFVDFVAQQRSYLAEW